MAEKFEFKSGLLAGGLTGTALSIICALAVYLFPGIAMGLFNSMIHSGISFAPRPFEAVSFAIGLIMSFVIGAITVGIFMQIYNALLKK